MRPPSVSRPAGEPRGSGHRASGQQPRQGEFVRRAVEVKSIPVARIVDREHGIALYPHDRLFRRPRPASWTRPWSQLSREGMRAVIWDLRGIRADCSAATSVLDRFIDSGVLVSTRGRSLDQNSSFSASSHPKYNIPMCCSSMKTARAPARSWREPSTTTSGHDRRTDQLTANGACRASSICPTEPDCG